MGAPGRWPGLLVEWRAPAAPADPEPAGVEIPSGWIGRVVYVVDKGGGEVVLVEAWVPAEHLRPA